MWSSDLLSLSDMLWYCVVRGVMSDMLWYCVVRGVMSDMLWYCVVRGVMWSYNLPSLSILSFHAVSGCVCSLFLNASSGYCTHYSAASLSSCGCHLCQTLAETVISTHIYIHLKRYN